MDLGKYVAVGVLAVIVLAAVTYEAPKDGRKAANDPARVEGSFGPAPAAPPAEPPPALPVAPPVEPATPAPVTTAAPASIEAAAAKLPELLHYTVKAGQTLRDVAQELLGDRRRWQEVARANKDKLPDPDLIREGMDIVFPREQATPRATTTTTLPASSSGQATTVAAGAGGRTYTVAKGDTLFSIAKRELGGGGRWKEIKSLNGLTSDQVAVGTVLKLPAR